MSAIVAEIARHLGAHYSVQLRNGKVLPPAPGARDDVRIVIVSPAAIDRRVRSLHQARAWH